MAGMFEDILQSVEQALLRSAKRHASAAANADAAASNGNLKPPSLPSTPRVLHEQKADTREDEQYTSVITPRVENALRSLCGVPSAKPSINGKSETLVFRSPHGAAAASGPHTSRAAQPSQTIPRAQTSSFSSPVDSGPSRFERAAARWRRQARQLQAETHGSSVYTAPTQHPPQAMRVAPSFRADPASTPPTPQDRQGGVPQLPPVRPPPAAAPSQPPPAAPTSQPVAATVQATPAPAAAASPRGRHQRGDSPVCSPPHTSLTPPAQQQATECTPPRSAAEGGAVSSPPDAFRTDSPSYEPLTPPSPPPAADRAAPSRGEQGACVLEATAQTLAPPPALPPHRLQVPLLKTRSATPPPDPPLDVSQLTQGRPSLPLRAGPPSRSNSPPPAPPGMTLPAAGQPPLSLQAPPTNAQQAGPATPNKAPLQGETTPPAPPLPAGKGLHQPLHAPLDLWNEQGGEVCVPPCTTPEQKAPPLPPQHPPPSTVQHPEEQTAPSRQLPACDLALREGGSAASPMPEQSMDGVFRVRVSPIQPGSSEHSTRSVAALAFQRMMFRRLMCRCSQRPLLRQAAVTALQAWRVEAAALKTARLQWTAAGLMQRYLAQSHAFHAFRAVAAARRCVRRRGDLAAQLAKARRGARVVRTWSLAARNKRLLRVGRVMVDMRLKCRAWAAWLGATAQAAQLRRAMQLATEMHDARLKRSAWATLCTNVRRHQATRHVLGQMCSALTSARLRRVLWRWGVHCAQQAYDAALQQRALQQHTSMCLRGWRARSQREQHLRNTSAALQQRVLALRTAACLAGWRRATRQRMRVLAGFQLLHAAALRSKSRRAFHEWAVAAYDLSRREAVLVQCRRHQQNRSVFLAWMRFTAGQKAGAKRMKRLRVSRVLHRWSDAAELAAERRRAQQHMKRVMHVHRAKRVLLALQAHGRWRLRLQHGEAMATRHHRLHCMQQVFRVLRVYTEHRRERALQERLGQVWSARRCVRGALLHWRHAAAAAAYGQAATAAADTLQRKHTLSRTLHALRAAACAQRAERFGEQLASTHFRKTVLRGALRAWWAVGTSAVSAAHAKVASITHRRHHRARARVLLAWHGAAQRSRQRGRVLRAVVLSASRQAALDALHHWAWRLQLEKQRRDDMHTAAAHLLRMRAAAYLGRWHDTASSQVAAKRRQQVAVGFYVLRRTSSAVQALAVNAAAQKRVRLMRRRADVFCVLQRGFRAWDALRGAVLHGRRLRHAALCVAGRRHDAVGRRTLLAWRAALQSKRQWEHKWRLAKQHAARLQLRRALHAWQRMRRGARAQRIAASLMVGTLRRAVLGAACRRWCVFLVAQRQEGQALAVAVAHHKGGLTAKAWGNWCDAVRVRKLDTLLQATAASHHRRRALRGAVAALRRRRIAKSAARRQAATAAASSTVHKRQRALQMWRAHVAAKHAMRCRISAAAGVLQRVAVRQGVLRWAAAVGTAHAAATRRRAAEALATRHMRAHTLLAWRGAASECALQRQRLLLAQRWAARRGALAAVQRWRANTEHARRSDVQRAVAEKWAQVRALRSAFRRLAAAAGALPRIRATRRRRTRRRTREMLLAWRLRAARRASLKARRRELSHTVLFLRKAAVLQAWNTAAKHKEQTRGSAADAFRTRRLKRKLRSSVLSWWGDMAQARRAATGAAVAARWRQRQLAGAAWAAWRRAYAIRAIARLHAKRLELRFAGRVLVAWRAAVAQGRAAELRHNLATVHFNRSLAQRCMQRLWVVAADAKRMRAAEALAGAFHARSVARVAFAALQQGTARRAALRKLTQSAWNRRVARVFHGWRLEAARGAARSGPLSLRAVMQAGHEVWKRTPGHGWRLPAAPAVVHVARAMWRLAAGVGGVSGGPSRLGIASSPVHGGVALVAALHAWRAAASTSRTHRRVQGAADAVWQRSTLRKVFQRLVEHASHSRRKQRMRAAAAFHWRNACIRKALAGWAVASVAQAMGRRAVLRRRWAHLKWAAQVGAWAAARQAAAAAYHKQRSLARGLEALRQGAALSAAQRRHAAEDCQRAHWRRVLRGWAGVAWDARSYRRRVENATRGEGGGLALGQAAHVPVQHLPFHTADARQRIETHQAAERFVAQSGGGQGGPAQPRRGVNPRKSKRFPAATMHTEQLRAPRSPLVPALADRLHAAAAEAAAASPVTPPHRLARGVQGGGYLSPTSVALLQRAAPTPPTRTAAAAGTPSPTPPRAAGGGGVRQLRAAADASRAMLSDSSHGSNSSRPGSALRRGGGVQVGSAQYAAAVMRATALLDDTPAKGVQGGSSDENNPPFTAAAGGLDDGKLRAAARRLGVGGGWTSGSDSSVGGGSGAHMGGGLHALEAAAARSGLAGPSAGSDGDSSW